MTFMEAGFYHEIDLDSGVHSTVYTSSMTRLGLRIGEVAERAGVSVDTVRYYERRSLLPRAPRSEGGFRLFSLDAIERLRFIKQAQEMGFSLEEIRMLLIGGGAGECRQTRDLLQSKLQEIDERMKALRVFSRTLSRHLRACEAELARRGAAARCPVVAEIGQAAKREAS
jgi:MerR family mercuric resistance operon transcriptional regulator